MADEIVTASAVLPGTDTQYIDGFAGVAITAGQTVYLDTSTSTYKLADADASSSTALAKGIAMNDAATAQPVRVAAGGHIDPGFTVGVGHVYVVSGTAGGIAPVADLAAGDFTHVVGLGITASSLKIVNATAGVAYV